MLDKEVGISSSFISVVWQATCLLFMFCGIQFLPTTLALSILDTEDQNPGSALPDFLSIHSSLSQSLSTAVQKHYQIYAASLPAHASLMSALDRAQVMVKETKKSLKDSRDLLSGGAVEAVGSGGKGPEKSGKRAEMGALWSRERDLNDMLKQLDVM